MSVASNTDYDQLASTDRFRCLCAEYQAVVIDRDTFIPIVRLPKLACDGTWNRNLNQTSQATVVLHVDSPLAGNCYGKLVEIGPWGHELVITRVGDSLPCWMGPIVTMVDDPTNATFEIDAIDRSSYFGGMGIPVNVVAGAGTIDAAQYFLQIYNSAKTVFDPQLVLQVTNSGIQMARTVHANDAYTLDDELTSITSAAVDWTVINTTMLIGAKQVPAPYITLKTSMWDTPPPVTIDARLLTTYVRMDGNGVSGTYPSGPLASHPFYGEHVHRMQDDSLKDVASCVAAAKSYYELNFGAQTFIASGANSSSLGKKSTVLPPQLIPGQTAMIAVDSGAFRNQSAVQMRLLSLEVAWTNGQETAVTPDFEPPGSIDVIVGGFQ